MDDDDASVVTAAYNFIMQQENDIFFSTPVASEDGVPSVTGQENDGEENGPGKRNTVAESSADFAWTRGKALLECQSPQHHNHPVMFECYFDVIIEEFDELFWPRILSFFTIDEPISGNG